MKTRLRSRKGSESDKSGTLASRCLLTGISRLVQRMSSLYKPEPLRWLDANISEETEEKLEQH